MKNEDIVWDRKDGGVTIGFSPDDIHALADIFNKLSEIDFDTNAEYEMALQVQKIYDTMYERGF